MFSSESLVRFIKYSFWFGVVNQFKTLQEIFYDSFLSIALAFGVEYPSMNAIWSKLMSNVEKILNIFSSWGDYMFLGKIETFPQMILLVIVLIIFLILAVRIMIELFLLKIQFYFTTGISAFFIPFEVFEKTRRLLGGKVLTTAIVSGFNIAVMLVIVSVVVGSLDKVGIEKLQTLKELKDGYEEIIKYAILTGLGCLLVKESQDILATLNGR